MAAPGNGSRNVLLEPIDYTFDETPFGVWRRFRYATGPDYAEFISHAEILGLPMVHYTRGICPETGRRVIARGVIAVGRVAIGIVGIGQLSLGIVAIGQLGLGLLLGVGQGTTGIVAVGQIALAWLFGFGQISTGIVAIGQFGLGRYVLAQLGLGQHVWDMRGQSPVARQFFTALMSRIF